MIPTKTLDTTVQSNFDGQKIKFSMDENSIAHIGTVLRELYGDIEESFCRELITNGIDSHIQAGNTAPIEVTLPTRLSPYLVFKDYGVGLSLDDMHNIYTKYGASTKRDSNAVTGSLGLGSKSPLAYTPSFTVTAVKDGVKILASVSLDEDEVPNMDIVDTSATAEPNGVEITIPAKRDNNFRNKIARIARFLEPGKMLVDGTDMSIVPRLQKVTDRIYTYESDDWREGDYVVMGSVAYPVEISTGLRDRTKVVAFVDMGSVSITPSRERLKDTERTRATLKSINQEIADNLMKKIADEISNAPTHAEAMSAYRRWIKRVDYGLRSRIPNTYKGKTIPDGYVYRDGGGVEPVIKWNLNASRHSVDSSSGLSYVMFNSSVNIVNYPYAGTISSRNKAKIRKFLTDSGVSLGYNGVSTVLLFKGDEIPGAPWVTGLTAYDWNDIAKVRLEPARARSRNSGFTRGGKYDTFDGSSFSLAEVTSKDNVLYFSPTDLVAGAKWTEDTGLLKSIQEQYPKHKIISVAKGRQGKLERNVKSAVHISAAYESAVDAAINAVSDKDKETERARHVWLPDSLSHMDASFVAQIKDEKLRGVILARRADRPDSLKKVYALRRHSKAGDMLSSLSASGTRRTALESYPLIDSLRYVRLDPKEIVLYINAKYDSMCSEAAAKEGN